MADNLYSKDKNFLETILGFSHKYLAPIYYLGFFLYAVAFDNTEVKSWIMIIGLAITLIFIGYSWYKHRKEKHFGRTKVVLLLPLTSDTNKLYVRDDVLHQLMGYSKVYIDRDNISTAIDFVIQDHKNKFEKAKELLDYHFSQGTEYFICTMSDVSNKLAEYIDDVYKTKKKKPILIATVTASHNFSNFGENIFRYYVRLDDEVNILYDQAKNYNSASILGIPSHYGREIAERFRQKWNNNNTGLDIQQKNCLILPNDLSEEGALSNFVERNRTLLNTDVIVIALYGKTIYDTIRVLNSLNIKPKLLLFTSTFNFNSTHIKTKAILDDYNWKCCVPKLKNNELYKDNTVKDFTYRSIDRLSKTIDKLKKLNNKKSFKLIWSESVHKDLYITQSSNGDENIDLQIIDKSNFS